MFNGLDRYMLCWIFAYTLAEFIVKHLDRL